jgi:hypothetical protein
MADKGFLKMMIRDLGQAVRESRLSLILVITSSLVLNGCTMPTTFRVLDAETKKPIEGAVALAMWDRTRGLPGLTFTYVAKAVEAETDAAGYFRLPAVVGTLALQKPHIKVYKPGYVGWDSRFIYMGCYETNPMEPILKERDFSMKSQDLFLEPWKEEYTFISHNKLIQIYGVDLSKAGIKHSQYRKAIDYERPFYVREMETIRPKR